jgi:cell division septal protein FtsQ
MRAPFSKPKTSRRAASASVKGVSGKVRLGVDCQPETPKIREQKRVAFRRAGFRMGVWMVVAFGLVALVTATWRQTLYRNPRFGLKEVTVFTEGALKPEKLVREMGLVEGMDTLWIDLKGVIEKVERLPQVKSASARRDYKGHMEVTVIQRRPVAWLECQRLGLHSMKSGFGCLLDEDGVAMPCDVILKDYTQLPVIRFEELSQAQAGSRVRDLQVKAALKLRAELEKRVESGMPALASIDIPTKYALVAHFDDGMEVTFGPDAITKQLARFDRVMIEAREKSWMIATLNLLPRDNVPVTFRQKSKLVSAR